MLKSPSHIRVGISARTAEGLGHEYNSSNCSYASTSQVSGNLLEATSSLVFVPAVCVCVCVCVSKGGWECSMAPVLKHQLERLTEFCKRGVGSNVKEGISREKERQETKGPPEMF